MSRRERQPAGSGAPLRRAVTLTAILSVVATLIAVGALAVALNRRTDQGAGNVGTDPNSCRTVAWDAVPDVAALPSGWAIASSRFPVGILTTTFVGPAPSGSSQGPAVFVTVSCYGSDAALALARDREAALSAGATDVSFPKLGDESFAVTSTRTSSTTVYIRRGILGADVSAATSLDPTALQSVAGAVDGAMIQALAASPRPSSTAGVSSSAGASPGASQAASPAATASRAPSIAPSSASPGPSAAAESHVAADLEALLPHLADGTALSSQSVLGTTALGNDATSQSLIASLKNLGKTPADLEIAEAYDPAGKLPLRVFSFRVKGVKGSDLATAIVDSWMANKTSTPVRSSVTIADHKLTKVAYAQGPADYVFDTSNVGFDIQTTDESLVSKVLPLFK